MVNTNNMVNTDVVFNNVDVTSFTDLVKMMGNKMYEKGFVKDSYVDAVIDREKGLPTGLKIGDYGIAIPHTDQEHVIDSVLGVATLKKPISVGSMIDPTEKLDVKLVFLMAVKNPDGQVEMLRKLMSVFQNQELLREIENTVTKEEMIEKLKITGL